MTDAEPAPAAKPLRTWRPMALWSAALLLALGLIWFVAAVVVPVWEVRQAMLSPNEIESLGGSRAAAHKLCLYLRMPTWLAPERKQALYLMEQCNPDNVTEWIILLDNRDQEARWLAADTLEEIRDPRAVGPLIAALREKEPFVRRAIIRALGTLGSPRAIEPLARVLQTDEPDCRQMAAYALGCMGPAAQGAVSALTAALKDSEESVRTAAAEALKKIRGEEPPK